MFDCCDDNVVEDSGLLGCDTVSLGKWILTFWRHHGLYRHQEPLIRQHGVT